LARLAPRRGVLFPKEDNFNNSRNHAIEYFAKKAMAPPSSRQRLDFSFGGEGRGEGAIWITMSDFIGFLMRLP
jgi:hypothetical protein